MPSREQVLRTTQRLFAEVARYESLSNPGPELSPFEASVLVNEQDTCKQNIARAIRQYIIQFFLDDDMVGKRVRFHRRQANGKSIKSVNAVWHVQPIHMRRLILNDNFGRYTRDGQNINLNDTDYEREMPFYEVEEGPLVPTAEHAVAMGGVKHVLNGDWRYTGSVEVRWSDGYLRNDRSIESMSYGAARHITGIRVELIPCNRINVWPHMKKIIRIPYFRWYQAGGPSMLLFLARHSVFSKLPPEIKARIREYIFGALEIREVLGRSNIESRS